MAEYVLSAGPTVEPLTAAEAKSHLRVDDATDDTLIGDYIEAARQFVEAFTRRQLITATWYCYLDEFPGEDYIQLAYPPLQSVVASGFKYYNTDGVLTTWAATNFSVDTAAIPGRIILAYGISWPSTRDIHNAIQITFKAGYGDAATAVPEALRLAMRQLISHWYENREAVSADRQMTIPLGVERLLWPYRDHRFS